MTDSKLSRAERMSKLYPQKLKELQPQIDHKRIHELSNSTTPEKEEKLKNALNKLKTFLD